MYIVKTSIQHTFSICEALREEKNATSCCQRALLSKVETFFSIVNSCSQQQIFLAFLLSNPWPELQQSFEQSVHFSCSVMSDSLQQHGLQHASLSVINYRSLFKLMSVESVMPSNHLILCHPLLLLPSIFPSIRVFSNESALHIRWPKYWSFSFNISPSNEYSGLIFSRMDWLDLLAVQGTLKSLLQHHSSKVSIL